MSVSMVWVDFERAKLFHVSEDRMEREEIRASHVQHHTHKLNSDERDDERMYREVGKRLVGRRRVLILGPGVAKSHLMQFLGNHFSGVFERIVGCEALDHPTDPELAAMALRFFGKSPKTESKAIKQKVS